MSRDRTAVDSADRSSRESDDRPSAGDDEPAVGEPRPGPSSDAAPDTKPTPHAVLEDVRPSVNAYFETGGRGDGVDIEPPSEEFVSEEFFDFGYLDRYDEVERYWVNRPYAYVTVLHDEGTNTRRYQVVEPHLDDFEEYVREDLIRTLRSDLMYEDLGSEVDCGAAFDPAVRRVMREHAATIADGSLWKLLYYLRRDFVGYGRIDPIVRDRHVEDISCDGAVSAVRHRYGLGVSPSGSATASRPG